MEGRVLSGLGSFVGPFSISFSIFIRSFAFISSLVLDLEAQHTSCSDLSSPVPFRTSLDRFTLELILKRSRIPAELYANEFMLSDQ